MKVRTAYLEWISVLFQGNNEQLQYVAKVQITGGQKR